MILWRFRFMYSITQSSKNVIFRRLYITSLAVTWFFGLLFGIYNAMHASDSLLRMMRGVFLSAVSIQGLLSVVLLPFLLSAFAVYIRQYWLMIPIIFTKALTFAFCACCIDRIFGSAGWLIRSLVIFSDGCMIPVLIWFWLRQSDHKPLQLNTLTAYALFAVSIGILDYCLVSPYLAMLI